MGERKIKHGRQGAHMIRYLGILVLLTISLGGCASYPDTNLERLLSLPQHYRQFDAALSWQVKSAGSQTIIDGEFRNIRYEFMENIEVWVAVHDAAGKTVANSVSYLIPHEVKRDDIVPFSLRLPVAVSPGTRLYFTYKYSGTDGGDDKGGDWTQSFSALVPEL
jgi:hypothetical protein